MMAPERFICLYLIPDFQSQPERLEALEQYESEYKHEDAAKDGRPDNQRSALLLWPEQVAVLRFRSGEPEFRAGTRQVIAFANDAAIRKVLSADRRQLLAARAARGDTIPLGLAYRDATHPASLRSRRPSRTEVALCAIGIKFVRNLICT